MRNKKSYVTIFPECEPIHLKKDVGMLPFAMGRYVGYDFKIITYNKHGFTEKNYRDYCVEMIENVKGEIVDFSRYLIKNAKKIDVLNLYHITSNRNVYWILVYKLINPEGKVHIKLDADYRMLEVFETNPKHIKGKMRLWVLRHLVDLYTVETTEMLNVLTSKWNIEMKLLPNGIYLEDNTINISQEEDIFLTVGRLGTEQKATEILLEAFKNIANQTSWNLVLVGPIEENFKEYINKFFEENSNLKTRVTFVGNIDDDVILKGYYERAKVFVLPSRWESFGLVLLEALERGDYLVVSNQIPSIADLSCDGRYCDVVPSDEPTKLGEAMLRATKLPISLSIREERRNWVLQKFSWKAIAYQLHSYLEAVEE